MKGKSFYNPHLNSYAHNNRHNATKAEASLWKYILKAKKTGHGFRRQRPVLNYIADFMCVELKLIIEVDGYTHLTEIGKKNDAVRQKKLEENGFKVIRFSDSDVLFNMDHIQSIILKTIKDLGGCPPPSLRATPS